MLTALLCGRWTSALRRVLTPQKTPVPQTFALFCPLRPVTLNHVAALLLCGAVNKQLNDKERVAAALENAHLVDVVNTCIAGTD